MQDRRKVLTVKDLWVYTCTTVSAGYRKQKVKEVDKGKKKTRKGTTKNYINHPENFAAKAAVAIKLAARWSKRKGDSWILSMYYRVNQICNVHSILRVIFPQSVVSWLHLPPQEITQERERERERDPKKKHLLSKTLKG